MQLRCSLARFDSARDAIIPSHPSSLLGSYAGWLPAHSSSLCARRVSAEICVFFTTFCAKIGENALSKQKSHSNICKYEIFVVPLRRNLIFASAKLHKWVQYGPNPKLHRHILKMKRCALFLYVETWEISFRTQDERTTVRTISVRADCIYIFVRGFSGPLRRDIIQEARALFMSIPIDWKFELLQIMCPIMWGPH